MPTTSEALESGEIPVGHARLIARASSESPIDESKLVEAAGEQPFDEFARTVKRHQRDLTTDDGQSLVDRQRSKRKARIFESSESGMFVLTAEFDQITGARIATALTAKERQLWHREDPKTRATPQQRMADALAELICEPASGRSPGTDLLVIADFDVLKQQLDNPRLADGSPIPIVELHRLALEANLLPSIFDTKAQDMWLGRRQRTASEAQRVALIARDQGCIGCKANPLWCRAHHIVWWSKDGSTDLENLALVCDDCHHKIHDHGWQVHKQADGRYSLKPPAETSKPTSANPTRSKPKPRPTPFAQPGTITIPCGPAPPGTRPPSTGDPAAATGALTRPTRFAQEQTSTVTSGLTPPSPEIRKHRPAEDYSRETPMTLVPIVSGPWYPQGNRMVAAARAMRGVQLGKRPNRRNRNKQLMATSLRPKSETIADMAKAFDLAENDTGSPEIQIALLSARIAHLTEHMKVHKKDHHTRRGLQMLVGRRRRLLDYVKDNDVERYRAVITHLGLRR